MAARFLKILCTPGLEQQALWEDVTRRAVCAAFVVGGPPVVINRRLLVSAVGDVKQQSDG
jgi:hypothetical protein